MGRFWEPKSFKNGPRSGLQKKQEQKTQKREIALPLNENPCFLSPTWSQNGSKMRPNACQETSEYDVRKNDPKMMPKMLPKCFPKGPKNHQNWDQMANMRHHGPESVPKGPQKGQKLAQMGPKGSQNGARMAQMGPNGPQSGPRRPRRDPPKGRGRRSTRRTRREEEEPRRGRRAHGAPRHTTEAAKRAC